MSSTTSVLIAVTLELNTLTMTPNPIGTTKHGSSIKMAAKNGVEIRHGAYAEPVCHVTATRISWFQPTITRAGIPSAVARTIVVRRRDLG